MVYDEDRTCVSAGIKSGTNSARRRLGKDIVQEELDVLDEVDDSECITTKE